jgi:hypothetical protein
VFLLSGTAVPLHDLSGRVSQLGHLLLLAYLQMLCLPNSTQRTTSLKHACVRPRVPWCGLSLPYQHHVRSTSPRCCISKDNAHVLRCAVVCRCCAVLWSAGAVLCYGLQVLCCAASPRFTPVCCAALCCRLQVWQFRMCCAVLCCAVLCCAVLCCAASPRFTLMCCAVLRCAVVCRCGSSACAVLCCAVLHPQGSCSCSVLHVLCCGLQVWQFRVCQIQFKSWKPFFSHYWNDYEVLR